MLGRLATWFDDRTGSRKLVAALLIEQIPGGARWRYVWGSCLAFVFAIQLITGVLLMTSYSAGDSTAWSSVYFIQYQMDFGWFIRGLHHFGSQTMVVLLGIHMLQVVIAGAHLPPREVNWWLGLGLLAQKQGNREEEINALSHLLELQPSGEGYLQLGRLLAQSDRRVQAIARF